MNYEVTLGSALDQRLNALAKQLNISLGEVLRRSLKFYFEAIKNEVKEVKLISDSGEERIVIVK